MKKTKSRKKSDFLKRCIKAAKGNYFFIYFIIPFTVILSLLLNFIDFPIGGFPIVGIIFLPAISYVFRNKEPLYYALPLFLSINTIVTIIIFYIGEIYKSRDIYYVYHPVFCIIFCIITFMIFRKKIVYSNYISTHRGIKLEILATLFFLFIISFLFWIFYYFEIYQYQDCPDENRICNSVYFMFGSKTYLFAIMYFYAVIISFLSSLLVYPVSRIIRYYRDERK